MLSALDGWLNLDIALEELPPEDRALLGNGERQGERGFPLGRARGPAATEKRGEGDPIPVGAFSHRQFSSKLERQPKDIEVHRTSAG